MKRAGVITKMEGSERDQTENTYISGGESEVGYSNKKINKK